MTGRIRQSNIELLRILAMFFVLIGHAGGVVMGLPGIEDFHQKGIASFVHVLLTSFAVGGVNIFVLISGWFGIHATKRGALKFIFQVLFLLWGIWLFDVCLGRSHFNVNGLKASMGLTDGYWFVMAYIGLYLLSPVLNAYVESATKQQFKYFLVVFYTFQCYYCWLTGVVNYFGGYSIMFFCGLYLTARYIRFYPVQIVEKHSWIIYMITCLSLALLSSFSLFHWGNAMKMLRYDNPIVILSALALLLSFKRISISSKTINWLAASSFAVYIIHFNPIVFPIFKQGVLYLSDMYSGIIFLLSTLIYLTFVYFFCVLVDQLRVLTWKVATYKLSV